MTTHNPHLLRDEYLRIRAALLEEFPELRDDAEALADTLDGEADAPDIIAALVRQSREDEAAATAVGGLARTYAERSARLAHRAEKRREAALRLMQAIELRSLKRPEFTLTVQTYPGKPEVYDEEALPNTCFRYRRSVDFSALKEEMAAGDVPGARMTNGHEGLVVRTK